jgi:dTDP-4-dehydrorhamnose 3,5-epimerase
MNVVATTIPDVLILEPAVIDDNRGFLYESFNARRFAGLTGVDVCFVQDNHSLSAGNVVRGLHYQLSRPQAKLVRAIAGEIFDVAVDLRNTSETFGQWVGVRLSAANRRQLWIPEGFAHGFMAISEQAEVLYKMTDYWVPEDEHCIAWNDAELSIDWPANGAPLVSPKDAQGKSFAQAALFG